MKRRALSFIIALALCLDLFPGWALAGDAGAGGGLCPHHPEHTYACGYAAPVLEQECTHIHNDDCYITETDCIHEHTAECYPDPDGVSGAAEPVLCTHVCTEDSGCITKVLSCPHEHDDTCGYAAGSPGAPCTFVCRICPIEDLIGRLPDSVSAWNIEQVQAQLGEIYDLYDELTEEEQQQVDLSPCIALLEQMDGMGAAALSDTSSSDANIEDLTGNQTVDNTFLIVTRPTIVVTHGYTMTVKNTSAIQVTGTGTLEIIAGEVTPPDSTNGAVSSLKGAGVEVQSGGVLRIPEPGVSISGGTYGLDIASGAEVHLSAGTYYGRERAIRTADGDLAALLEPGYIYCDQNGDPIASADVASSYLLTVGQCTDHSSKTYTHTAGDGTTEHTWICSVCKLTESEPCTFSFTEEEEAGKCACGNGLTVVVDEDDLSNLVYDGTVKPQDVDVNVTVTLTDDSSRELERDTDYKVKIESITNAGQATVTVTGITFNGDFVRTYTVEQATPGLSWANSDPVTVNYDGQPVAESDLPGVNITAVDNLREYLQYSYRKQGDTDYTSGLPTNAGTYDVIVSLPELPNFKGVVSEAITLTINPIAPIATAPVATTPTYNRNPQELVTAGALDPVAIADGLKIQFATSENGNYSAAIPTGTDAGDYTVWYKVTGLTDNYIAPVPNPAEITGVEIQRKTITPVVTLSQYSYLYDGAYKEPAVTVKDDDRVTDLPDTEYEVEYVNNRNVSTDAAPAKVVVTDKIENGGNYEITQVEVEFKITLRTQDALSITKKPDTVTYGDIFTLSTDGGSGNGLITWEITDGKDDVATVDENSGEVTIIGDGSATVKATKSGKDPNTNVTNYEDAIATWTFNAKKKPVTAIVTAEDKDYDGNRTATIHAVVAQGILPGDEITITDLTGTFSDENAGVDKPVTVVTTGATVTGNNHEHYAITYSSTTVKATINKAIARIATAPGPANLTYDGTAQELIATGAVVDPADVPVEYSLSETGPYTTDFPKGINAGTYTVWYRVQETPNYTGLAPASVDATIAKKTVSPTITLGESTFTYDGTAKEPVVTLYEADDTTLIPAGEYTVTYSNNINVGTATVTVTAKDDGNYTFENAPVTANFTITQKKAEVITAPEAMGDPLTFNNRSQKLVTEGVASGGTMVYRLGDTGGFETTIPTGFNAQEYTVYYKVQGDANHSDSDEGSVTVTIIPKTVKDPTIELQNENGDPLVSYTYDGSSKKPKVVVKDGSTVIADTEYNIVYSDNTNAGHGTVNITAKPNGNYTVTGSATFVINKADIVFTPDPKAADITYDGQPHELLVPGTTTGGTVLYALNSATSTYRDAIPTGINAGTYNVYYKVTGDNNHNDLPVQGPVSVTIARKPLTTPTIELTPNSFQYDGAVHLPTVTVKDGETVLPASEYAWECNVSDPKDGGTYTITISDKTGGNYDLTSANPNTATFTIGKAAQAELVIEDQPEQVYYGDSFKLSTRGGSGDGGLTWSATGPATMRDGDLTITGVGTVNVTVVKAGDTNYDQTSAHWTFTAAPKPVMASVTVNNKLYDGTTAATVASAGITVGLETGDTITIDPASITAVFDTPNAGTGKTVTLDASRVQVTGDTAKYAISYPDTVTADITQATTTIDTAPAAIAPLTYNGQPQELVTAGQTNVGFLVYSLDGTHFSPEIPTGTNAGTYTVYYEVDATADYTGVAVNTTPISVTIGPKNITSTVQVELSETSFLYDGTKKNPMVTVMDGDTVIAPDQYKKEWDKDLTSAGTHTVTISEVSGKNYTFSDVTAAVEITPAEQAALHITGKPEHVYYGDTITNLGTTGGTGEGTVKWSVTAGSATIEEGTGKLTITGIGAVTVRAERSVPNYGTVGDNWNFTVEPKPVTAEVTVAAKTYDGTTTIADTAIKAQVKTADLVGSDTVTLTGLTGTYTDPNAGTGKTVTLDSTGATATGTDAAKYAVTYPATAKGDITPKDVTVTVTLSDHDLQGNATDGYYYVYDGTEKSPKVIVTAVDGAVLAASDYSAEYTNNRNVGKAAVTVTAKEGGNYTFTAATVNFEIRSAAAELTSSPQAKDLTYEKGTQQELVTVGTATGGTVVYSLLPIDPDDEDTYSETIPKGKDAGTYTVYYMVKGDANHDDTTLQQMTAIIKPKQITPTITLEQDSYVYDGTAKTPTVTVKDGTETIADTEYSVSYRDNVNAGTATVTVSDANGGNYIVNGTATFKITEAAPTVTPPTAITGLQYNGEARELVNAGVTSHGTVVYSLTGGNYSSAIPVGTAVGTYTVNWKVQGDANHSDTTPATLTVGIDKNTVTDPTITLSQNQFTYNGNQQKPDIAVYDNNSRLIPEHEYTATITGTNGNNGMVKVDTYTVTIAAAANSNYAFQGTLIRTFEIIPADQETISITGTQAQVRYGDTIQLGITGGTGSGTVKWEITGNTDTMLTQNGLLTVKDVNTSITVTVTRSRDNYGDVSATWEFTAGKKPVTAEVTATDRNYAENNKSATVTASVPNSDLVSGDSITISGLTGTFDDPNVGTDKTVTLDTTNVNITGTNVGKYDVTIPATTTASILAVPATVGTKPAANTLTYDASQAQALVTAGTATGGTMVYSLDGNEFTPNIPKGKDAGTYTVYYKAQGDQNHTDSAVDTVSVTIGKQTVTPKIELSPPSGQYDGKVQQPKVTVRDTANNVIPTSEYTVVYDPATNWKDVGKHKVKVQNITGVNYIITEAEAEFEISTTAQAPLEIVNKPGLVYYGDTFTLSATGGSSSSAVTWSVDDAGTSVVEIDANGFVKIVGTGSATIKATKPGGTNYEAAEATYPLNALKKPVTAIVTADDKVYDGNTNATIHITWSDLVGNDVIDTKDLVGAFEDAKVGTNKKVTITGDPVSDATAQKYDITIPASTTASITKSVAAAPNVTAESGLVYTGSAQALVTGGDTNTLYSGTRDGVYSATVPEGTNAGTYTVWYKEKGDDNHNDSAPQAVEVTISPKTLTATDITLSGNDLKTDTDGTYYYEYDGTEKTPNVVVKDGSATVSASEYTVTYSDNKNVSTAGKKATVTITDNEGGNYTVSGSTTFEIRKGGAQLTTSPQAKALTYEKGVAQELVTVGTATGGHIEYSLNGGAYGKAIPKAENAGIYTVAYKVVGDDNHEDDPTVGSVSVTISPKTVISPKITVNGSYTYTGSPQIPAEGAVDVKDGTETIPATEYILSYRDNTNAGTATVIVTDNNGGNYTVNGTETFQIGKAAATVGTAPTGKTDLKYNGTAQELLDTPGTATGGTMVYSLSETGEYSAAIPTGKAVGEYEIWYMVQGDDNHSNTTPVALSLTVKIAKNTVTKPTINVEPASVKFTGKKQEPTVTVKDDSGLLIDGSEYKATYADTANGNNSDLTAVGTYTVTITEVSDGNYTFDATGGKNTATFTITPADQTPLTITGTRERVYYGDTIQLSTTGGIDGGTVTWKVSDGSPASIDEDTGLLKITGVGSVTVTATSTKIGYAPQTATWRIYVDKKPVTAVVTAEDRAYNGEKAATLRVTWKAGDLVGNDNIETAGLTGEFTDANVGANKTVTITGTLTHANYDITVPPITTASIFKANIEDTAVTAPTLATGLTYTGLPLTLIATAGTVTGGTMEYSTDGTNYSASLPTGTNAGDYDVWYRVKGDGNHNDTTGTKLTTDTRKVTIGRQSVTDPIIELTPNSVSYDGKEHKPEVTVKDNSKRVIPVDEYTFEYGIGDWTKAGTYKVKVTGKTGGNYNITDKEQDFIILVAGQSPLSITNKPGKVQYGDTFTLSAVGGSITGAVTWSSSAPDVASIGNNGLVTVHKSGSVTITAKKLADGNYGEVSDTWSFSAEKKPVTAIVTAEDKVYDATETATLVTAWKAGDLLNGDTITLTLTGKFNNANVGDNKTVTISGDVPASDKYTISYNQTTTASITPAAASVTAPTPLTVEYTGQPQDLVSAGIPTNGTITYSLDGIVYGPNIPQGTNAGSYTVWYKVTGNENYKDVAPAVVPVTIQPKTVNDPTIELSPETFDYDGTPKKPDVVVKDGNVVIPASEYTVSYSNNVAVGTNATVTISDVSGGNYTVSGSATFTIKAGEATLKDAPKPNNLTYNGFDQELVTAGTAVNGQLVYSEARDSTYTTSIPMKTDAGSYQVWYKVQGANGAADTAPKQLIVTIQPKEVTPIIRLENRSSYSVPYTGIAQEPDVTVYVESKLYNGLYNVSYANNINVGTAEVTVQSMGGNYQFLAFKDFTITKGKAEFSTIPTAKANLVYNGTAQALVSAGTAKNSGIVLYSLNNADYSTAIPTAIERGSYTVYAKVQGSSNYEESDVVQVPVTIGVNTLSAGDLTVTLSSGNLPYTGSEVKPTVTVTENANGNVIDSGEYTVTYTNNVNVGTATVSIKSKTNGNYSFTATAEFQIVDASQTPLAITGKQDTVYYGDTLSLGTTGGGSGTVTWSSSDTNVAAIDQNGVVTIKKSGSVTITAAKGGSTDTWTFVAKPKPVTATVYAVDKVYNGDNTVTLTVTLNGLLPGDTVSLTATGSFIDEKAGTNKNVLITGLNGLDGIKDKYTVSYNSTTTASITPKPAAVTAAPTLAGSLTYNGGEQPLLASGGTADGGNLMYSLDGRDYSYTIPTGTDAKTYTVWYKVEASDDNHKDSAAVKLGTVTISANTDKPTVLCTPATFQYDGTEKTPTVVVRDSANRIIPESEYTVTLPSPRIAVGKYSVTVTDKSGGNYKFDASVEGTFEIVASSQPPLSIITDIPTDVHYGDTFRLSAMGGTGSGAIQWSIEESNVATINTNGVVTVTGTGGFTVKAYRAASGGYSDSNTDSVPFVAKSKPVTPVVTASDKPYDGKTDATLTASWKSGDLVDTDTITLTVSGTFDTADAGTNKRVSVIGNATGTDTTLAKYAITWPDSTTASIYKVDTKLATAPADANLTYTGSAQALVTAGSTAGNIGKVEYSTSQNGAYSETIPTGTNAGTYFVWYKVADSVNYTGIAPASIQVEIRKAVPSISTAPTASGTAGQPLSKIGLNGGATSVGGKFAWANDTLTAEAGRSYDVIFTPDDTANYTTVTIQIVAAAAASDASSITPPADSTPAANANSIPTRTTIQDGTARTVMSAADGNKLVKEAVESQSETVVIKPEITGDVTKAEVSIPSSTVRQIQSETNASLTVSTPIADATISREALNTLSSAGGGVSVAAEQAGQAVVLTLTADGETVGDVPGGVTLTVPAEDAGPGTVAVLVKEDGTREVIQRSMAEDGKMNIPLNGSATVEIVDNGKSFDDVPAESWASEAITFASARELFGGTSETTFSPDQTMSRAMVATVLYRLEGQPEQAEASAYSDVGSDDWYTDGVAWAAENGIVNGYGDGQFGPNDRVTREQFIVMLWRYVGSPEASDQDLSSFSDAGTASSYALEALCWAVENGILSGNDSGDLQPGGDATRAEAAQMLKNFLENT